MSKYSNTVIAGIVALIAIVAAIGIVAPTSPVTANLVVLVGIIVTTLLGIRQSEANGHRLDAVEDNVQVHVRKLRDVPDPEAPD